MALTGADFKRAKAEVFRVAGLVEPPYRHESARTEQILAGTAPSEPTKPTETVPRLRWRELERYPYVDRDKRLLFEVIRYLRADGRKTFRQCRTDGNGSVVLES